MRSYSLVALPVFEPLVNEAGASKPGAGRPLDPFVAEDAVAGLHKPAWPRSRALNNAAIAALIAAAAAGIALVDDDRAKKAVAELTRD